VTTAAEAAARAGFSRERLAPQSWSNRAGYRYDEHQHDRHKVLFCIDGSITFRTAEGETRLDPGDRLDLPAGTAHSATVGPEGVTCMEAFR
jgi:quercetin dioxygenase-like cupin family protein